MKIVKPGLLVTSCVLLAAVALPAQAVFLNDEYVGADDHGDGDVIGNVSDYQIFGLDLSRSGNILTVSISTNFAGKGDDCLFGGSTCGTSYTGPDLTSAKGIGYGDLFLSDAYTPFGMDGPAFVGDNAKNGNPWTYGFAFDNDSDRWTGAGASGSGTLYNLNGANSGIIDPIDHNPDALLSENFLTTGRFRTGQEVAVNKSSPKVVSGNSGTWSITGTTVNFNINLAGTALENSDKIALHWAMTCANDTIEVVANNPSAVVPVPAAVWLMGSGLLGLVSIARRRQRS